MSDPGFAAAKTRNRVIELIPGEHYVVFTNRGDSLPDADTVEELRIIAYARRNKGTLGPAEIQTVETLASTVASGVVTNVVWAGCQMARDYVGKFRSRRRERIQKAEEAAAHALEAAQDARVPVTLPAGIAATKVTVSGTGEDGTTWRVSCEANGKAVQMQMDACGAVIDIEIKAAT